MVAITIPDISLVLNAVQIAILLGFGSGLFAGEAFAKFDGSIKYSDDNGWFKNLSKLEQALASMAMDSMHHFQIGLFMMLICKVNPWFIAHTTTGILVYYYGLGLVVSDWKDFEHVLERLGFVKTILLTEEDDDHILLV